MKSKLSFLVLFFILCGLFLFSSCAHKVTKTISISFVANTKLVENAESPMPANIVSFIHPIECGNYVYVPKVTIYRTDLGNDSAFTVEIQKEAANKIRDYFGTYDYNDLKGDYDRYLPELKAGLYLSKTGLPNSTKKPFNYSSSALLFILTDKISTISNNCYNSSDKIVSVIKNLICNNNFDISKRIIVILDDNNSSNARNDSISADSAISDFYNSLNNNRSIETNDSALQKLEREYPNDYRFTLERLKIRAKGGSLKKSDEYLLLLAVEKAINEGKASEILAILNKMNLPLKVKKEAEKQIAKPFVEEKPLAEDKTISFRKQQIDAKLIILADASYSPSERKSFKSITLEDFESPEVKVSVESTEFPDKPDLKLVDDFLNDLRLSKGYQIKLISKEIGPNGKISSIRVLKSY